jgi:hypothetical protein
MPITVISSNTGIIILTYNIIPVMMAIYYALLLYQHTCKYCTVSILLYLTTMILTHPLGAVLVSNARAQKTRESFKQFRERSVREKEGGKTQPNLSPP